MAADPVYSDKEDNLLKGRSVFITGLGSYSPGEPVPFDEIENVLGKIEGASPKVLKRIEKMRPIVKEMLGIEFAYYALDPKTREMTESNISMAVKSANKALASAGIKNTDIDLIVYAGVLYDYMCPPSSAMVQEALGIPYCAEISIHSNCTAIYKAIQIASDMIANGRYKNALLVTSQLSSSILRAEYYNPKALTFDQAILRWFLCDGAGALVLSSEAGGGCGLEIESTYLESVGMGLDPCMKMECGAIKWNTLEIYENGWHHLTQDISKVTQLAHDIFRDGFLKMLNNYDTDVSTIKCFFLNIPTRHFMDVAIKNIKRDLKNPDLPVYTNLRTRGYQGAPSIVIALDEYMQNAKLTRGDCLMSFVTESSKWMNAGFILKYSG